MRATHVFNVRAMHDLEERFANLETKLILEALEGDLVEDCGKDMLDVCCVLTSYDEYNAMVQTGNKMSALSLHVVAR